MNTAVVIMYLVDGTREHELLLVLDRVRHKALQKVAQGALATLPCLDGRAQDHGGGGLTVRQLQGVDHHRQGRGFIGYDFTHQKSGGREGY